MNLLIHQHVAVIWHWQWDVADDLAPSPKGSLYDMGNNEDCYKADSEELTVDDKVDDKEDDKVDDKKDELELKNSDDDDTFSSHSYV